MKLIDLLSKKASGKLVDGFDFVFHNRVYEYIKAKDIICNTITGFAIGYEMNIEVYLNDVIYLMQNSELIEEQIKDMETKNEND